MGERRFLIQIDARPVGGDCQELLELVLAAVSLDVPARIVVADDAVGLFDPCSDSPWRQLTEQDLIEVFAVVAEDQGLPVGVQRMDQRSLAKLAQAQTVIRV